MLCGSLCDNFLYYYLSQCSQSFFTNDFFKPYKEKCDNTVKKVKRFCQTELWIGLWKMGRILMRKNGILEKLPLEEIPGFCNFLKHQRNFIDGNTSAWGICLCEMTHSHFQGKKMKEKGKLEDKRKNGDSDEPRPP